MAKLDKEIIGRWFEIRSNLNNPPELRNIFFISEEETSETMQNL